MVTPDAHRVGGLRRDQRLAAQHAVLIAERKAHDFELAPLDLALDRGGGAALLGGPQIVAIDEAGCSWREGIEFVRPPNLSFVMPGLVPGIHAFRYAKQGVDGRDKPGHDVGGSERERPHRPLAQLAALRLPASVFCQ